MLTWPALVEVRPDLTKAAYDLLYQHGVGLAFLATVRADGGPRVHPMCPVISAEGMFAFIVPGPKQADLHRDGRFALHSFPCDDNEDAAYLTGRVVAVGDGPVRAGLAAQFVTERAQFGVPTPAADHHLFAFEVEMLMVTTTGGHGDGAPHHEIWRAQAGEVGALATAIGVRGDPTGQT